MLKAGLYLHDLNMFDNSRDLVLAGQQCASDLEYSMEKVLHLILLLTRKTDETLTSLVLAPYVIQARFFHTQIISSVCYAS